MKKTKQVYVLSKLIDHIFAIGSFDLWMSKGAHDIFAFVINFLGFDLWLSKGAHDIFDFVINFLGFDLWLSKGAHDIFVFVINFLGFDWQPK